MFILFILGTWNTMPTKSAIPGLTLCYMTIWNLANISFISLSLSPFPWVCFLSSLCPPLFSLPLLSLSLSLPPPFSLSLPPSFLSLSLLFPRSVFSLLSIPLL
uniref:Uncharacterized protein n=1 Tax=Cacopsylla melanoneura TaxID=428564 RepID=A0A8D8Z239_9HEMI